MIKYTIYCLLKKYKKNCVSQLPIYCHGYVYFSLKRILHALLLHYLAVFF